MLVINKLATVMRRRQTGYCIYSLIRCNFEIVAKSKCILCASHTKREGNIWHNLWGNKIILFFNINNEYMNNKQFFWFWRNIVGFSVSYTRVRLQKGIIGPKSRRDS